MDIFDLLLFSGFYTSMAFALNALINTKNKKVAVIYTGLYICHGMIILFMSLYFLREVIQVPFPIIISIYFFYWLGPLIYLMLKYMADANFQLKKKHWLLFLPGLLLILESIPFYLLPDSEKMILFPYYKQITGTYGLLLRCSVYITGLSIAVFIFLGLRQFTFIFSDKELQKKTFYKILMFIVFECFGVLFSFFVAFFLAMKSIHKIVLLIFNQLILTIFLFSRHYPDGMQRLQDDARKARYIRSQIAQLNIGEVKERLTVLMEKEKLFTQPELTLESLAEHLNITPHQLSELLNSSLNLNFKSYINQFRIMEAKRLLVSQPARSIIEICFDVGFNSKSNFNKNFSKIERLSPSDFRKKSLRL